MWGIFFSNIQLNSLNDTDLIQYFSKSYNDFEMFKTKWFSNSFLREVRILSYSNKVVIKRLNINFLRDRGNLQHKNGKSSENRSAVDNLTKKNQFYLLRLNRILSKTWIAELISVLNFTIWKTWFHNKYFTLKKINIHLSLK